MTHLREDYELPRKPPVPMRQAGVMVILPLIALGLWLALPHTAITVALLALLLLGAVFTGVGLVLRSSELSEPPGRHPIRPPSLDG